MIEVAVCYNIIVEVDALNVLSQ